MTAIDIVRAPSSAVQSVLPLLMAQATHDLNNQLTTILGQSELALMVDDAARWKRSLNDIQQAGRFAQRLVADIQKILTWSLPHQEPVQLGDILDLVRRLSLRRAEQREIELRVEGDAPHSMREGAPEIALGLWFLVSYALDRAPASPARWSLHAEHLDREFTRVTIRTPGAEWDMAAIEAAARRQRLGSEPPANALDNTFACLHAIGARGSVDASSFYVELRR